MALQELFGIGEYYHTYNRGVEKRAIFSDEQDRERFLALLYLANSTVSVDLWRQGQTLRDVTSVERDETLTDMCIYCLMPNHFHLLLREKQEKGISTFMQKITTAYTMYFNRKNGRSGALFQGTYKAKRTDNDEYLKYLVSYIHLNPVKLIEPRWKEEGIANKLRAESFLREYPYSSYLDFASEQSRPQHVILTKGALPEYFATTADFNATLRDWLEYKDKDIEG